VIDGDVGAQLMEVILSAAVGKCSVSSRRNQCRSGLNACVQSSILRLGKLDEPRNTMTTSLRTLLTNIIDYAGLFPPAKLPLDQAIRNYARYRQEADSWMLGRFICPAARLAELRPFIAELFPSGSPLAVSALGRQTNTGAEFLDGVRLDLDLIAAALVATPGRLVVDVLETRLPAQPLQDASADLLRSATKLVQSRQPHLFPFFEIAFGPEWRQTTVDLATACAAVEPNVGLKLRTGGLEAAAFPAPEQVAYVIEQCHTARVPLKFTAGLHHPLRHFDVGVNTHMHGFVNVFGAGALAYAKPACDELLCRVIEDEDSEHFRWDEESFRWRDRHIGVAEIQRARQQGVISFGSCSFDEPREDLRRLGWL
jgi:hypothetical protein